MSSKFTRRSTLEATLGWITTALMLPVLALNKNDAKAEEFQLSNDVFQHGVASGDPQQNSVVLWTRVTTMKGQETVNWEIAKDNDFQEIVERGMAKANQSADHTVKVIPQNLEAGATYYYRFHLNGTYSGIGRTKTLTEGKLDHLGIALASCSNFAWGYFNAYDAIAKDEQVDFVLHTGDYIYEYGTDGWGGDHSVAINRAHNPAHEIVTLDDYRKRHAQYKADRGSLAMHAAHSLLVCWDDHESANNPWIGGAENHQPETEGEWSVRLAASLQAYYEWMPIRDPKPGRTREEFWRSYVFGDLLTLVTLESRHTARGKQVDYLDYAESIQSKTDAEAFMRDVIGDPDRKMISEAMEQELETSLSASVKKEQPWRIIGNPCPIARMLVPDVEKLGVDPSRLNSGERTPNVPTAADALFWKGRFNLPFYTDTWDGYPAAREKFYDLCKSVGASDLLVLTGDSHSFWANKLYDQGGHSMGIEIGTAGISSPGDFVNSGWDDETSRKLDKIFVDQLDEVIWTDNMHQGYVRVHLSHEEAKVDFIAMSNILTESYEPKLLRSDVLRHDKGSIDFT